MQAPLLHPLDLLDQFLLKLQRSRPTSSSSTNSSAAAGTTRARTRTTTAPLKNNNQQIIEISEFLYGKSSTARNVAFNGHTRGPQIASHPPSGSILESTLELLDSFDKAINPPATTTTAASSISSLAPIRMIIAKDSGRRAIVVRGSQGGSVPAYICTLGFIKDPNGALIGDSGVADDDDNDNGKKCISSAGRSGYHCSCRSFFERLKSDRFALCKHLLAARLAPFLCMDHDNCNANAKIYEEERIEEEDFARMYTRISLSSW
jgi:hypothetical protein